MADQQEARDLADVTSFDLATTVRVHALSATPRPGDTPARALRDGLRSVQLSFREASPYPDAPGDGPGEQYTGAVS